ncbi:MAG: UDP-N-acetylmuramoyl-tripeptide--D-alanyl-D-alanine ligase [Chloroflexi bacterium]|jgi:UDP-N-acetylmuramoyl-tripeptide--D-alanyl-D-alanine ligase|nr:UDP-N-acetylmuramoyl-tripeptide--D-alanyl-D-alanine ligase [Chloroflexota bacterium]
MPSLNLAELLAELAPSLRVEGAQDIPICNVCIDSRQAGCGSLFVALRGERSDGHDYVGAAFQAGATVALVERPTAAAAVIDTVQPGAPASVEPPVMVVVPDALRALQLVARGRRLARPDLRVLGVTGSVGKTTTKEAIAFVLAQHYRTLKNAGNFNNEIGLPLTLMQLENHEYAVLEMGMYTLGEIRALCALALPQIGVVTNVGPVHLERLGTVERVADAKAELVEALPEDGVAVLNGDDPLVRGMRARTRASVVTFGLDSQNDVWADAIVTRGLEGTHFTVHVREMPALRLRGGSYPAQLATLGSHTVMAALPAIAVGLMAGLTWEEIQAGLLAQGYGTRLVPRAGLGGVTLLDDTYNASPASVLAALGVLAEAPGRRLAVLGDMLELGTYEEQGHRLVGERCAEVVDGLIAVGTRARMIADAARHAARNGLSADAIWAVDDNASAIQILRECVQPGDTVLVKGSRSMGMEAIVAAFEERTA